MGVQGKEAENLTSQEGKEVQSKPRARDSYAINEEPYAE